MSTTQESVPQHDSFAKRTISFRNSPSFEAWSLVSASTPQKASLVSAYSPASAGTSGMSVHGTTFGERGPSGCACG